MKKKKIYSLFPSIALAFLLCLTCPLLADTCVQELTKMAQQHPYAYIKIEFNGTDYVLKTALRKFSNENGITIVLAGTVHVANASYYENIRKLVFDQSDLILYEYFGAPVDFIEPLLSTAECSGLWSLFQYSAFTLSKALNLACQGVLHPFMVMGPAKYVHADKNSEIFSKYPASKIFGALLQVCLKEKRQLLTSFDSIESYNEEEIKKEKRSVLSTCKALKEDFNILNYSEMFNERNTIVLTKLDEVLRYDNQRTIAILYGARHQPTFEAYITDKLNFKHVSTEWLDAFNIQDI